MELRTHSSYLSLCCFLWWFLLWCSARYDSHHHDQIPHVHSQNLPRSRSHDQILPQGRSQGVPQPAFPYQNPAQSLVGHIHRILLHRLVQLQLYFLHLGPADNLALGSHHLCLHLCVHQEAQGAYGHDWQQMVLLDSQGVQGVAVPCQGSGKGLDGPAEGRWAEKDN